MSADDQDAVVESQDTGGDEGGKDQESFLSSFTSFPDVNAREDEDTDTSTDADDDSGEEEEGIALDPDAVYQAAQVGLDLEQVKKFKDKDSLLAAIDLLRQRGPAQKEEEQDAGEEEPSEWFTPEFDEEWDDDVKKVFSGMNDFYKEKVQALHEQNKAVQDMLQAVQASVFESRFESAVNNLGDEWKDVLGKGEVADVDEAQKQARVKLIGAVDRIMAADYQGGRERSMSQVLKDALAVEFGDKIKEMERKKIASKAKCRTKIARPEAGKGGGDSEEDALAFIRDGLSSLGAKTESSPFAF